MKVAIIKKMIKVIRKKKKKFLPKKYKNNQIKNHKKRNYVLKNYIMKFRKYSQLKKLIKNNRTP